MFTSKVAAGKAKLQAQTTHTISLIKFLPLTTVSERAEVLQLPTNYNNYNNNVYTFSIHS